MSRSITDTLYRLARASATGRSIRKGKYPQRVVRRSVYREEGKLTRRLFRNLGRGL